MTGADSPRRRATPITPEQATVCTSSSARPGAGALMARAARGCGSSWTPRAPEAAEFLSVGETKWRRAARGQGLLVSRRLHVHRAREQEDRSIEIRYLLEAGRAGRADRDGGSRVGELGDAVLAHAPGDPDQLGQRLGGGVRA